MFAMRGLGSQVRNFLETNFQIRILLFPILVPESDLKMAKLIF